MITTTEYTSGEITSKSPEPRQNNDDLMERCMNEMQEISKTLTDTLKAREEVKRLFL